MKLYDAIWDKNSTPEQIKQLIDAGALLDDRNDQVPPLYFAAEGGRADIIEILLGAGADVDKGECFATPLIAAAQSGDVKAVEVLLNAGADINAEPDMTIGPVIIATARMGKQVREYI